MRKRDMEILHRHLHKNADDSIVPYETSDKPKVHRPSSNRTKTGLLLTLAAGIAVILLIWRYLDLNHVNVDSENQSSVRFDSRTHQCQSAAVSGYPLVTFGIVIDAGSTGSRIHVYKFNFCRGPSPDLEDELFEQLKPGLSHYAGRSREAAESLDPLLRSAFHSIPVDMHHCTPIIVKATAGLRLLKEGQADAILDAVEAHLRDHWPFSVPDKNENPVSVMDGKDEALFAWVTVNYLLNKFHVHPTRKQKQPTAGIMDLGGGSTQIVFEPNFHDPKLVTADEPTCKIPPKSLRNTCGDFYEEKEMSNRPYVLYQHSYLGYGLKEAQKQIKLASIKHALESLKSGQTRSGFGGLLLVDNVQRKSTLLADWISASRLPSGKIDLRVDEYEIVSHPCLAPGHVEVIDVDDFVTRSISINLETVRHVILTGPLADHPSGAAGFQGCSQLTSAIFEKSECTYDPPSCSFNGIYQPHLETSFTSLQGSQLYAFSYFYDRTRVILKAEHDAAESGHSLDEWKVRDLKSLARAVCDSHSRVNRREDSELSRHLWAAFQSWEDLQSHIGSLIRPSSPGDDEAIPELCLDLTYIYHLLSTGYGLSQDQVLKITKKINGIETGWCLGATIELIEKQIKDRRACFT